MLIRVNEGKKSSAKERAQVAAKKQTELQALNLRLQMLLDPFLDGIIDRNEYDSAKADLMKLVEWCPG